MAGKQAKYLSAPMIDRVLVQLQSRRNPERDRVIFLLSVRAGLRACEIAGLEWAMVTDALGDLSGTLVVPNRIAKGTASGRTVPLHPQLADALSAWRTVSVHTRWSTVAPVVPSERDRKFTAHNIVMWFQRLYGQVGLVGCSSHSGRRTFITNAARQAPHVGASLRDVQKLAGHAWLSSTERYIEENTEAQVALVGLL